MCGFHMINVHTKLYKILCKIIQVASKSLRQDQGRKKVDFRKPKKEENLVHTTMIVLRLQLVGCPVGCLKYMYHQETFLKLE